MVLLESDGVYALVAEWSGHRIRRIIISTVSVTPLAGGVEGSPASVNGIGTNSGFHTPSGVSISPDGVYALVADRFNNLIRHIIISTASVTTLVGRGSGSTDGVGTNSGFSSPHGISFSPDGVYALVVSWGNPLIRRIIISTASVTTLAGLAGVSGSANGIGTNARFKNPAGVSISPDGAYALVIDTSNHLIRRIILSTPAPSLSPTSDLPITPSHFSFGVKIGAGDTSKAILVDYLEDDRTGNIQPLTP